MHTAKPPIVFSCISGCSDCCIYREYYPSLEFGKIGVLILPEEKQRLERLARKKSLALRIIPRLAVGLKGPEKIIAYQMMGKNADGDLCPFLDLEGDPAPHGGLRCSIYKDRPAACSAYPVISDKPVGLDPHCRFCKKHSTTTANRDGLQQELESLSKIRAAVKAEDKLHVWRYATATGTEKNMLAEGWVLEI